MIPAAFPPPVDSAEEFIGATDDEDERIEVGVAIVGGGQAGLACAIRLLQLLEDDPELTERLGEVPVAVIEKGKACGAHQLSGAVMNPSAIQELFPDDAVAGRTTARSTKDAVYFMLNPKRAIPLKPTPPPFRNHGNYVVSVAELNRWLAEKAEEAGAYILTETSAHKLLVEDGVVRGVRTGDKGRDKDGEQLGNFEPGSDVTAQATVLAEGCWGHLTGAALSALDLAQGPHRRCGRSASRRSGRSRSRSTRSSTRSAGRCATAPSTRSSAARGSTRWASDRVSIGFVVGLDYADAPSRSTTCCRSSSAPARARDPRGRQARRVGREGDPRGRLLGDAEAARAGHGHLRRRGRHGQRPEAQGHPLRDPLRHARRREIYAALKAGSTDFSAYEQAVDDSEIGKDLYQSRNMKQPFAQGLLPRRRDHERDGGHEGPLPRRALGDAPRRRGAGARRRARTAAIRSPTASTRSTSSRASSSPATRRATTRRTTSASRSACRASSPRRGSGCAPPGVYEIPEDAPEDGHVDLIVNPTNCVQCGAITAKGGRLTPPEGGDGPLYQVT